MPDLKRAVSHFDLRAGIESTRTTFCRYRILPPSTDRVGWSLGDLKVCHSGKVCQAGKQVAAKPEEKEKIIVRQINRCSALPGYPNMSAHKGLADAGFRDSGHFCALP